MLLRPPAIRSKRKEAEEWPTHAQLLLLGRREEQLPPVVLGPGSTETSWCVWGTASSPVPAEVSPSTAQSTTRSFPPLLRELLALEWERRRLLVSPQGSPFAHGLSGRAELCTSLGMAVLR